MGNMTLKVFLQGEPCLFYGFHCGDNSYFNVCAELPLAAARCVWTGPSLPAFDIPWQSQKETSRGRGK